MQWIFKCISTCKVLKLGQGAREPNPCQQPKAHGLGGSNSPCLDFFGLGLWIWKGSGENGMKLRIGNPQLSEMTLEKVWMKNIEHKAPGWAYGWTSIQAARGTQQTWITEKEKVDDALDKGNGWPFERKWMRRIYSKWKKIRRGDIYFWDKLCR